MIPPPAAPDRLAAFIKPLDTSNPTSAPAHNTLAILGCPDDTGVSLNKGIPGARFGPAAFRAALAAFGTQQDALETHTSPLPPIYDAGDAFTITAPNPHDHPPANVSAMHRYHDAAQQHITKLQAAGYITALIGGGNDFTRPAVSSIAAKNSLTIGGINVDPHLDMRERPGSGMPYRTLIESQTINPALFSTIALGRFTNNQDHLTFARDHNVHLVQAQHMLEHNAADDINEAFNRLTNADASFLSIDLDAIDAAHAPGVSARNPAGITPTSAGDLAERAGRTPNLVHFELVELNPLRDDPPFEPTDPSTAGRTARLAAYLFRRFVAGVAQRPTP